MATTSSSATSGSSRAALALLALLWLLPLGAARARENPRDNRLHDAQVLARQGFAAYDRGDYQAAIRAFEQAYAIAPTPGLLYNIAQAHRQRGPDGCADALAWYRRYQSEATGHPGPVTGELVAARIDEMERCVRARSEARDAAGEPARPAPEVRPAAPRPPAPVPAAARPSGGARRRVAGWVAIGVGGAGLGLGAVTGGVALARQRDLEERCPDDVCPADQRGEVRAYDRLRLTALVSGALGLIAVGAGVALVATASGSGDRKVTLWIGHASIGVRASF